jgi:GR25 family glycosyltransferase involved in LPS biosynthesis
MAELSYSEKLKNFPSVNYTSLRESADRRAYMQNQFDHYGITKTNVYLTERFEKISDYVQVTGTGLCMPEVHTQMGTIISHINLLRNWYISTDEEYAIFCEDDVSFESIKHWNFTWDEFVQNLPEYWNGVQLTKVMMPYCNPAGDPNLSLKITRGRWWGAHSLLRRPYVKVLLDRVCQGYNSYQLDSIYLDGVPYGPIIENLLYLQMGGIFNFPMLFEDASFDTTYKNKNKITVGVETANDSQYWSHRLIAEQWRTNGATLNFKDAMTLKE